MKQLLWDLFRKTGKIEYYIQYKKMDEEGINDGTKTNYDRKKI